MAFAVKRGEIEATNLGCNRFTPLHVALRERLERSPYFAGNLSEWVSVNPSTKLPYLDDETVSFIPMEAVSEKTGRVSQQTMAFSQVATGYTRFAEGDVLWAKITPCMQNGKSGVAKGLIKNIGFGSTEFHVLRPKTEEVIPEYLWSLLSLDIITTAAQAVFTGSAGQQRVPDTFLKTLPFPKPPKEKQKSLLKLLDSANESRQIKNASADTLLSGIDSWLLGELGVVVPKKEVRAVYAIQIGQSESGKQLGADYYHPQRLGALRAIKEAKKAKKVFRLGEIVDFIRDTEKEADPEKYIGLANIESNTGELASTTEEPGKGQCFIFQNGDVLYGRLRPYLNKVWSADRDGVCSTEFHVLRIKPSSLPIHSDYLAAALRSSLVVAQTKHMMTGNTHPRLANNDVMDLLVPIPNEATQTEIVLEIRHRRDQARRLRREAEEEWEVAKARFEVELLGNE